MYQLALANLAMWTRDLFPCFCVLLVREITAGSAVENSGKLLFSDKKHASHQGQEPSLFLARAVFLARKVFPAFYFALAFQLT